MNDINIIVLFLFSTFHSPFCVCVCLCASVPVFTCTYIVEINKDHANEKNKTNQAIYSESAVARESATIHCRWHKLKGREGSRKKRERGLQIWSNWRFLVWGRQKAGSWKCGIFCDWLGSIFGYLWLVWSKKWDKNRETDSH